MLIETEEVDRLVGLIEDIRSGRLPEDIAGPALLVFFAENPHLLMLSRFDEHIQTPLSSWEFELLSRLPVAERASAFYRSLPLIEFRTTAGRWATLAALPSLVPHSFGPDEAEDCDPNLVFSVGGRLVLRNARKWHRAWLKANNCHSIDEEESAELVLDKEHDRLAEVLNSEVITVEVEELLAHLRQRVCRPRERSAVLWSPRFWTPSEQARQRALLDSAISPHLESWRTKGICFDDLNPSEFEDLVGEVLLAAGMKIHKVRETPQGGRDLIARGILVPGEEPVEMAVEVKHRRTVDRPEVQLALYQNRFYPALLFVTSGRFTAGVFDEKLREENRLRLFLKDGFAIGDMVRFHFRIGHQRIRPGNTTAVSD